MGLKFNSNNNFGLLSDLSFEQYPLDPAYYEYRLNPAYYDAYPLFGAGQSQLVTTEVSPFSSSILCPFYRSELIPSLNPMLHIQFFLSTLLLLRPRPTALEDSQCPMPSCHLLIQRSVLLPFVNFKAGDPQALCCFPINWIFCSRHRATVLKDFLLQFLLQSFQRLFQRFVLLTF